MFWDILWVIAGILFAWIILKELFTQFREFRSMERMPGPSASVPDGRPPEKDEDPAKVAQASHH
jgi:hypothetical protein